MGHYYADLMCDTCGNLRCTCPPKEEVKVKEWLVTDDFKVMTVEDFDELHSRPTQTFGHATVHPVMMRFRKQLFKKRKEAEAHAVELCQQAVEDARFRLQHFTSLLETDQPWRKK